MKLIAIIYLLTISNLANAQTPSSAPTYTVTSTGVVLDASGQQDADPQEPVTLNATEKQQEKAAESATFQRVLDIWKARQNAADAREASDAAFVP
jgi:hypothetical protein